MNFEIRQRIEQIKNGEVPEGYRYSRAGLSPNDWDSVHLYQIAEPIVEQAGDGTYETLSISAGIGFVNQAKKFGKELSGKQYEKYTVLNRGDFSYNKGNSKSYPQGCIYRLKDRETAAVPNVFESFRVKRDNSDYYEQLFISGYLNKQLSKKINHGVRDNGLLNLTEKDFYSCYIPHPSVTEQQKIAEILMQCDKLIKLYKREVDELQKLKKTCMHKMFPRDGETVPEMRLPGFTEAWEQRKLDELSIISTGYPFDSTLFSEDGEYLIITNGNIQDKFASVDGTVGNRITISDDKITTLYLLDIGDILVTMDGTVGRTAKVVERKQILAQRVGRLKANIDREFLYQWLNTGLFSRAMSEISHGGTIKHISLKEIGSFSSFVPRDIKEQQKIGAYFANLDRLITLHQRKAEEMKKQKKSLMQLLLTGIVRVKL